VRHTVEAERNPNKNQENGMSKHGTLFAAILALGPTVAAAAGYTQSNLSADTAGAAAFSDPLLQNPWGLSVPARRFSVEAFWWAADNASGVSTLYDPTGMTRQLVVTIPSADGTSPGSPTGTTWFNKNFVFVTEDGTMSVWYYDQYLSNQKPSVAAADAAHAPMRGSLRTDSNTNCSSCHVSNAVLKVKKPGAAFEGVTATYLNGSSALLVANVNSATLDAYDANFAPIALDPSAFSDPALPAGYTATNVQAAGGLIWVVYQNGMGGGYVDGYRRNGRLKVTLQSSPLDDPWGVAVAPSNFGTYSNAVLIGNVTSGKIAAFDPGNGNFLGYLGDANGKDIVNPGLWAIAFGIGNRNNGPTNVLYFNAGGADQTHGLFGAISAN
jgi:uncharacterized protein (TIGR03118 family)